MKVYFDTMKDFRGKFIALVIHDNPSREDSGKDERWTIKASADVTEDGIENIRVESVERWDASWSKAAGWREVTEDHEGQNPDMLEHLNSRVADQEWDDILIPAALSAYDRELIAA